MDSILTIFIWTPFPFGIPCVDFNGLIYVGVSRLTLYFSLQNSRVESTHLIFMDAIQLHVLLDATIFYRGPLSSQKFGQVHQHFTLMLMSKQNGYVKSLNSISIRPLRDFTIEIRMFKYRYYPLDASGSLILFIVIVSS